MFQSTPSHGGRPPLRWGYNSDKWFQSTPSHGGRLSRTCITTGLTRFQSTPSHGGRLTKRIKFSAKCKVSIHALTWRATIAQNSIQGFNPCFNPRPHMEGDKKVPANTLLTAVSIHALTWRATKETECVFQHLFCVSIHALTWRATTCCLKAKPWTWLFQSTPSHGGRQQTRPTVVFFSLFQSTPSHGGRLTEALNRVSSFTFQSTPSHGGRRLCVLDLNNRIYSFNPRPHMEGDVLLFIYTLLCSVVSIHALTWRATSVVEIQNAETKFQSTPSHGGRLRAEKKSLTQNGFQSTPSHGGRHEARNHQPCAVGFQSTPSHGGRPQTLIL